MNWLHYLAEANIYLGVFYLCYCLLLTNETHYTLNRAYLLFACVVSFVLPVTQLSILKPVEVLAYEQPVAYVNTTNMVRLAPPPPPEAPPLVTWQDGLVYAYLIGAGITLVVFLFRLYQLYKLSRSSKQFVGNSYQLVHLKDNDSAFSFFNYLFIGTNISKSDTIIAHELVHIRQKHSWDIMLLEILKIVSWFNPFIYLTQRSLKTVHEYIADEQTAAHEQDALTYSSFLLNNAYGIQGSAIAHSFFNYNLLKKRIIMLNKNRSGKLARLKYLAVLPLCGGMLCASTLAFAKDYGWVDLTPKIAPAGKTIGDTIKKPKLPPPPPAPRMAAQLAPPPPPPPFDPVYSDLITYMEKHTRYPAKALENKVDGYIKISLRLNAMHKITDIQIAKGIGSGCDEEVVRALKSYGGTIQNKPGRYILVVNYILIGANGAALHHNKPIEGMMNEAMIGQVDVNGYTAGLKRMPPPPPAPPLIKKATKVSSIFMSDKTQGGLAIAPPLPGSDKNARLVPPSPYNPAYITLYSYLARAVRYPSVAYSNKVTGNVTLSYKLDNSHKIIDVKVLKGIGSGCDEETVRAMKQFPGTIDKAPGEYFITTIFALRGYTKKFEPVGDLRYKPNFAGTIIIMGYPHKVAATATSNVARKLLKKSALVFFDGKRFPIDNRITSDKQYTITANDSVHFYTPNNAMAIKKWGTDAKYGVAEYFGNPKLFVVK